MNPARDAHKKLADIGVRIFKVRLYGHYGNEEMLWLHPNKTTAEWRAELSKFLANSEVVTDIDHHGDDKILNALYTFLSNLGYIEIDDMVSDAYEGKITNEHARIVADPDHVEDVTGFGHYGWDARGLDKTSES